MPFVLVVLHGLPGRGCPGILVRRSLLWSIPTNSEVEDAK